MNQCSPLPAICAAEINSSSNPEADETMAKCVDYMTCAVVYGFNEVEKLTVLMPKASPI